MLFVVCVVCFCVSDTVAAAKAAGAVDAGAEDLVAKIEAGWMEFDVAVASPDMMRVVSKLGKVLGPKGLMPSPKAGTVAADVVGAVRDYSNGKQEYRNDDGGNIHGVIGKLSFDELHQEVRHLCLHEPERSNRALSLYSVVQEFKLRKVRS